MMIIEQPFSGGHTKDVLDPRTNDEEPTTRPTKELVKL